MKYIRTYAFLARAAANRGDKESAVYWIRKIRIAVTVFSTERTNTIRMVA